MRIFLLGLPGAGKSTLGKALALELNTLFVDLDLEIEKETGQKIARIFADRGEPYFRKIESDRLKNWIDSSDDFIMATGGGTPCFFNNMHRMKEAGKSIFLDVPVAEIVRRINTLHLSERPLFAEVTGQALADKVEFMRLSRLQFYQQAEVTLTGIGITIEEMKRALAPGG